MRRASRVDGNHRELFDAAKALGAYVVETFTIGKGCPDGFVYHRRTGWFPVEVKAGKGKLRPAQVDLHALVPVVVWRTLADVQQSLGTRR